MSGGKETVQRVVLDEGSGAVVVRGGITVKFNVNGGIDVYGDVPVALHSAANDSAAGGKTDPVIGDKMDDGTVYAGISPNTGKAMYATPKDAPGTYRFGEAEEYAENLDAHGHHDFRVPNVEELYVLFNNRAAIGGFNGSDYWTSARLLDDYAWSVNFRNGSQNDRCRGRYLSSLRPIRCESRPKMSPP